MRRRRSQELSADPLCGTGRSTLDEKHIVNYILSCNATPPRALILALRRSKVLFCRRFNSKQRQRKIKCVEEKHRKYENMKDGNNKDKCIKGVFPPPTPFFFTVFVAGNRNVVDGSELETGAGQDLQLHGT